MSDGNEREARSIGRRGLNKLTTLRDVVRRVTRKRRDTSNTIHLRRLEVRRGAEFLRSSIASRGGAEKNEVCRSGTKELESIRDLTKRGAAAEQRHRF